MRKIFLYVAFLISFSCEGQPSYYQPSILFMKTEPAVFLVMGDSKAAGSGITIGPTTGTAAVYEWDQTTDGLIDRATTDFSNANIGSPWKQFAIDYNLLTGRKVVIIATALAGSELYPNSTGTDTHWDPMVDNAGAAVPGGTGAPLYTNAKNEADSCLLFLKKATLDGIIINLGVNDARGSASLGLIRTGFTEFHDRLNLHFPGVPIYYVSTGRPETATINDRLASVKSTIRREADARSYLHIFCNELSFDASAWGLYQGDNLHPTQAGNNQQGTMLARYIKYGLAGETNKEVKQVWASFKTEPTTVHKAAWKTWVEGLQSGGDWTLLESFQPYVGNVAEDVMVDVRLLAAPQKVGYTFNANANISVSGTSAYLARRYIHSNAFVTSGTNDFLAGVKLLTNSTAAGTDAYLLGVLQTTPSRQIVLLQTTSGGNRISWFANDNTAHFYNTDTSFSDNTLHSTGRTGTTKHYYKDATSVASATQASSGVPSVGLFVGARNSGGTPQVPITATVEYSYVAAHDGFDLSNFITLTNTLITALQTP